jgi:type VI secretion system lysozyme-like protein
MGLLRKLAGDKGKGEDNEIKSIIDNLNNVLNTTRGYGYFLNNFGISDYKYLCTREDVSMAIIAEITENIKLFEPRIVLKQIVSIKDDTLFRLSFRIDCVVRSNAHSLKLFLDPVLDHYQILP